jgi:hypothetical protein
VTLTVPLRRRRSVSATVAFAAIIALLLTWAVPAYAQPTTPPNHGSTPTLDTLRANLESAAIGYLDAEAALQFARSEQEKYQQQLTVAELDYARIKVGVGRYAGEIYKTGRAGVLEVMLNARTQDEFLKRTVAMNKITQRDEVRISQLIDARARATSAKSAIDSSLAQQEAAASEMEKRKVAAERALVSVGGGATRGWLDPNSRAAAPAPRNPNGSWPSELCSINDPTTDRGCLTPRTSHALKEAQKAGFSRYVACYRTGDRFEHPKGRACDFAAAPGGFGGSAGGGDKVYGSNLAYFYVKNAAALGVMYVVWYCEIWIAGSWKRYNSAGGNCGDDPSGDHTNHVHVSIY